MPQTLTITDCWDCPHCRHFTRINPHDGDTEPMRKTICGHPHSLYRYDHYWQNAQIEDNVKIPTWCFLDGEAIL